MDMPAQVTLASPRPAAAPASNSSSMADLARRLREAEARMAALGKPLPPLPRKGGRHEG